MRKKIGFEQFGNQNQSDEEQLEQINIRNKFNQGFQKLIIWEKKKEISLIKLIIQNLMIQNLEINQLEKQKQLKRDNYIKLLEETQEIVVGQLFILDSIHRRQDYEKNLGKVWRYQINGLSQYQRFQLYDQLKQLKSLLNVFKLFGGWSHYLVKGEKGIWKQVKELLDIIKADIDLFDEELVGNLELDMERIIENGNALILVKTQERIKQEEKEIFKDLLDLVVKLIDGTFWKRGKVLRCNLCSLKQENSEQFFLHLLNHLEFLQILDANLGRCMDNNCKSKRNIQQQDFNLGRHLLQNHSKCYEVERPLRFLVINNKDEYGTSWKKYQIFKKDIAKTLKLIDIGIAEQFEREYVENTKKGESKEIYFKIRIKEWITRTNGAFQTTELELLDYITIYLTTTWSAKFQDSNMQMDESLPNIAKQLFTDTKVPYYTQQLRLLEVLTSGSQLESLKVKLLLGYYNNAQTFQELVYQISDLEKGLQGIVVSNSMMNGRCQRLGRSCLFNDILCQEQFETVEEAVKHYFKSHIGVMACISNKECDLKDKERIDLWLEHCHDTHKDDAVTLISKYLKQQKVYFQFKAVCYLCTINLQSLTETYWIPTQTTPNLKWQIRINIQWKDLLRSYNEENVIDNQIMKEYQENYEEYKKNLIGEIISKRTYNNEGKIAACKACKSKKLKQMTHLKKEQFANRESNKLFPLVKMEGKITRRAQDTFFRVKGNLNALKEKPHIFFAGSDIMYEWNSTQAKKQFKCKLMDYSQAERKDYVSACQHHGFLVNHSYQLVDLTKQLLRQEQQILEINKNLWLRYLEKENISNAKDKLQLEFSKMQDMLLFDGLLHRTSVQFVCGRMKKPIKSIHRKLRSFLEEEESLTEHPWKFRCLELLDQYEQLSGDTRLFWEITMLNYLICEQRDDSNLEFQVGDSINSLQELLLLNREANPFGEWFRVETLGEVQSFLDNAIHPIYLGVHYEETFRNFRDKNSLNVAQRRMITGIFQTQALLIVDACLLNHGYTIPEQNNTFFQAQKDELRRQQQFLLHEILDVVDDQQYIDMQSRISLVEKATVQVLEGKEIEEIIPSDLRWAVQIASLFLSSLKAQLSYFHPGSDRDLRRQHLDLMRGLEEEIEYFYARNNPTYNQDFLTTTYREVIMEIVENEVFPKNSNGQQQIRQFTQGEIERLSKYENLRKLHFVFWMPVEQKLKNLLTVHKVLRELVDKEPYFQMSKHLNVTSFYKELEFAMFPNLYPNAQGGLVTKVPQVKSFQLIVDLVEQEKLLAPQHIQQLAQLRQNIVRRQRDRNQIINSNDLDIEIQLVDFNVRDQFGNPSYQPTKAIYNFLQQPIINVNQSMAYILELQQLAPLQYEQQRMLLIQSSNLEWTLPEIAHVNITVNNQVGSQSVLENHVAQNLDRYLYGQRAQWDNEKQQFISRSKEEVNRLQRSGRTREEIDNFLMIQKKMLIDQKIKQLSADVSLKRAFNRIKKIQGFQLDQSVSTSESEDEGRLGQRRIQEQRALDEINQFNRRVLDEVYGRQIQQQQVQPQAQIQQQEIQELIDLDKQKIDLSVDTKFRLNCSFTESFLRDHKWIMWRYYEWIKSQFYCYQKIVNKERGVMVYQQGEMKRFTSIPPICGSETELQEKYKEIRAFCYEEGPPLIMLTITSNEFDEKTFKVMRGINQFDLEDEVKVLIAERRNTRDDDINQNANLYVVYYNWLVEHLLKVIQNKFSKGQQNPRKYWSNYSNGLFGQLKAYVKRIEFQERGSIHFHILLFLNHNEGQYEEKLLLYLKGILSCFRMDKQTDKNFITKFNLLHKCNANRCLKVDDQKCREGFPQKLTSGYVNTNYPIEVKQRRLQAEDQNVISYWKLLVRHFNSNVQVQITADERIISYLMKYINKKTSKQDEKKNDIQEEDLQDGEEEKQIMDIIKQFYSDKITHLQEACLAFQSLKLVEATYKIVKISQVPLSRQQQNTNDLIENLDNLTETFNWKNKQNIWNRYLKRPSEFEHFNLMEFVLNCFNYGKKQTYLLKYNKERENQEKKVEDYKFFLDQDGCIVKIKEIKEYKKTIIVKTLLHSTEEYGAADNLYYLEMLQLYWPHRYQEWINATQDEYKGYKEAYQTLIEVYQYRDLESNPLATFYRLKYCKFLDNPLKRYSEMHNQINLHQKRMLEALYRHKFNLQYSDSNENNKANQDLIFQIKLLLTQQLDLEFGYLRVNQIKEILDVFNPSNQTGNQELLDKANQLLEDVTSDVKDNWLELPSNTQNIITSLGQLYKHYGCEEIVLEIRKYNEKGVIRKSNASGQDLNLSQLQLSRLAQNEELEIPISKEDDQRLSRSRIQEEIPIQLILQEKLEDFHTKFEGIYKNKLTIEEHNRNKIQREIKIWNIENISEEMQTIYLTLNYQQRLAIVMMITNLTMSFKEIEDERRYEGTFIHGPGGVGKSYIIATMVKFCEQFAIRYAILCPTQFAAQNLIKMCEKIGIQETYVETIHSFFKLRIDQGIKSHMHAFRDHLGKQGISKFSHTMEIYQKFKKFQFVNFTQLVVLFRQLDLIIIEEVSMMDPDFITLLDIYGQISRQSAFPFGGIQVFVFGDSFQLQPVMKGKANYFDSHVFKGGYFTHIIELTQSVRQAEDLDYFEKILQPIRFGSFGEYADEFYDQMKNLERRVVPDNLFRPNQDVKKQLEEKKMDNQQVISLYFKNENVEFENEKRAVQIIEQIEEKRRKGKNKEKKRFRQYIKQPIQFRWTNQKTEEDIMALLLGQKYEFKKEVYEANFNHQTHFLMLPIGIRNYLAKQLGQIAYRIALKQEDLNKTSCIQELILFEKEEIIIRKNIEKQANLINGQFSTIKSLEFDVDYINAYSMRELERDQAEFIKERNYYNMLDEIKNKSIIRFTDEDKKEMDLYLEKKQLMNINFLDERDVHQSEKGLLYLKDVDPRLQKIILKIGESGTASLEIGDKAFQHSVNLQKGQLLRALSEVEEALLTTHDFVIKTLQWNPTYTQAAQRIRKWLLESEFMELFGIDYINGHFGVEYLERSIIQIKYIIQKLPNTCQVQISQIPINLGYARTIHCSQGSTFENVIMDLDMPERQQSGLLYTALSRVRRIDNLYLSGKLNQSMFKVRVSNQIKKFYEENIVEVSKYLENDSLKELLEKDFKDLLEQINEMSSDLRQALIQLKLEKVKIQNH